MPKFSKSSVFKQGVIAFSIGSLLSACIGSTVYHQYKQLPQTGWDRVDDVSFDIPPLSKGGSYKEEVGIRFKEDYPFMKFYLVIEQTILPSHEMRCDTLVFNLINEQGRVMGKGLSRYQCQQPLGSLKLNEGDSIHIVVRHNMRREILTEVNDIGIRLTRE